MNESYNKMKYFEEVEGFHEKIYYHYTSLSALYEIVKSRTFRLMSLKSSNDKKELYYTPQSFQKDIKRICTENDNQNIRDYFGIVLHSLENNHEIFLKSLKQKKSPYALCLATKKDNLTHWDRYADNCKGVCIGFNVSALYVLYQRMNALAFGSSYFDIGNALYSQKEIENYIIENTAHSSDFLRRTCEKTEKRFSKQYVENRAFILSIKDCNYIMKFAKYNSFVDEDEVRLYHDANSIEDTLRVIDLIKDTMDDDEYTNVRNNFIELGKELGIDQEHFAMTKAGIRGYRNLCLDKIWGSGVIPEIIIGPQCVQNRNELQRFLKANGLEGTKVTISKVPIR